MSSEKKETLSGVRWMPPVPGRDLPIDIQDDTRAIATTLPVPPGTLRPIVEPIHLTKAYEVNDPSQFSDLIMNEGRFAYQRLWNRTTEAAELTLAELEQAPAALLYNSGIAAMSAVFLTFLKPGDHILTHLPSYSGTFKILSYYLPRYDINFSYVPAGSDINAYRESIKPNTKLIFVETPCNPDCSVVDIQGIAELGKEKNILTCVDGTFASPAVQKVIPFGIDFSLHSCSKYIGGHDDVIAGSLAVRTLEQFKVLKMSQYAFLGSQLGPFEAHQVHRGLKTLVLRMERHSINALLVATALEKHPAVSFVSYPGLVSHPGHQTAKKQMKGFSGMVAFELKGGKDAVLAFTKNLKVATLTISLGGLQTGISCPYLFSHGPFVMSDEERKLARVTEGLIRLSVGLEDGVDIRNDLLQALDATLM